MENRWSIRKELHQDIALHTPDDREAVAQICNIGLEGIYIRINPVKYNVSDTFTINMRSPVDKNKTLDTQGIVRHVAQNGVGVMFFGFNLKLFRSLQKYLYCNTPVLNPGTDDQTLLEPISKCHERRRGKAKMNEKAEFTRSK